MNVLRAAVATAAVLFAAAPLPAASAACNGTDATVKACLYPENVTVDLDAGPLYEDCVTLGDPDTCHPLYVPRPAVGVGGVVGEVSCGLCATIVPTVTGIVMPVVNGADERIDDAVGQVADMRCAPSHADATGRTHWIGTLGEKVGELVDSCL